MKRTLIVARMRPESADAVAETFAESDRGDLPDLVGVENRTLFRFHDLYFHLIEASEEIPPRVRDVGTHELFTDISEKLRPHIAPYDPDTWRGPSDAMATPFYSWHRGDIR